MANLRSWRSLLGRLLPSDSDRKVDHRPVVGRDQAGHSLGHSTCRNSAGQERTQQTTPLT
jgi:hypothetical protein